MLDQDPEAGAQLAEGQTVRAGRLERRDRDRNANGDGDGRRDRDRPEAEPNPTETPDLIGLDFREAADAILDAGLLPTSYPVNSAEDQGVVLAQNPDSGSQLREGAVVRMNVSLGPGDRAEGDIPDVTGQAAEESLRTCHDAGFTCRVVERTAPDEESRGEIIDQTPAAGATAPSLTQITLFLGT